MSDLFLTNEEVAELTGIKRASNGKSRQELQCSYLAKCGIPHHKNVLGEPKISRAYIEFKQQPAPIFEQTWTPRVISA